MIRWLVLAYLLGLSAAVTQEVYSQLPGIHSLKARSEPSICVVVRTYWGHNGVGGNPGLRNLLRSLQRQSISNWEAVLVVMDSKPFMELAHILQDLDDDRIWVFAEWIGSNFSPRMKGEWAPGYHGILYDLTDEAVFACSPDTRWVLVTNGDNEYSSSTFQELAQAKDVDIVAFDYYSRYQRPTGPPCERFARAQGLPACKVNKLNWCQTDLGANALNWSRLVHENRKFGLLRDGTVLTPDHFDGVMAETLVAAGWEVKHISGACHFEHSPSPQKCAREGAIWDDTSLDVGKMGGDCITSQAAAKLLGGQDAVEEVLIEVSNDGRLSDFMDNSTVIRTSLRCLRRKDMAAAQLDTMKFFGRSCASDIDIHLFEDLAPTQSDAPTAQQVGLCSSRRSSWGGSSSAFSLSNPPKPPPRGSTKGIKRRRYEPSLEHPA